MTPGDIAMMLNETSGLRVQTTSPSLGGASVRVQGLRGRYTQVLSDGLPLYGGQSGALGLLQIPPMDLGQVEVIKGAASALYGASALGGVVNLVSRRPADDARAAAEPDHARRRRTRVRWASGRARAERWGYTLLGGAHRQARARPWTTTAGPTCPATAAPWCARACSGTAARGARVFVTVGGMAEDREGGTIGGATDARGHRVPRGARRRGACDAGLVGALPAAGGRLARACAAPAMAQRHGHRFGDVRERDRTAPASPRRRSAARDAGAHLGRRRGLPARALRRARRAGLRLHLHHPLALRAGRVRARRDWLTLAASGRVDRHSEYGTFFSPRVSALLRPAAGGRCAPPPATGYYAPTPFTEETEAVGPRAAAPAGRARGGARAQRRRWTWAARSGALELNATALRLARSTTRCRRATPERRTVALVERRRRRRAPGATELLARYHRGALARHRHAHCIRATEPDPDGAGAPRGAAHAAPRAGAGGDVGGGGARAASGWSSTTRGGRRWTTTRTATTSRPYVIVGAAGGAARRAARACS